MEQFGWFDIIISTLILLIAIKGAMNGFMREVFGLVGIIGGIILAWKYNHEAGVWISENLFSIHDKALNVIGGLGLLIGFWLLGVFVGYILTKIMFLSGNGFISVLGGFFIGGAKVFLIFSALFAIITHVAFVQYKLDQYTKSSIIYPMLIQTGSYIVKLSPKDLPSVDDVKDKINDNVKDVTIDVVKGVAQELNATVQDINISK